MDDVELVKKLSITGKNRVTLYLSAPKVESIYLQTVAEEAGQLIDVTRQEPLEGRLMRYIGPAKFTTMTAALSPGLAGIPQAACEVVSQRRHIQEEIIRWKKKDVGTVVLRFTLGPAVYASIASTESLDENLLSSYFQ